MLAATTFSTLTTQQVRGRVVTSNQFAHNTETPLLDYNDETELTAVVNLVCLAARDSYYVERENKAGKGFVDFIFYPEKAGEDGIILELKVDDTPETVIAQIKEWNYMLKFRGRMAEKKRHSGRILLVRIGYEKRRRSTTVK